MVLESTPMTIAARIREAIASGVIPPGAQIGEAEFARQLAVSRDRSARACNASRRRAWSWRCATAATS